VSLCRPLTPPRSRCSNLSWGVALPHVWLPCAPPRELLLQAVSRFPSNCVASLPRLCPAAVTSAPLRSNAATAVMGLPIQGLLIQALLVATSLLLFLLLLCMILVRSLSS
jgi:hypothetical protein